MFVAEHSVQHALDFCHVSGICVKGDSLYAGIGPAVTD